MSFIVQTPLTSNGTIIFGRNSTRDEEVCNEVLFFDRKGETSEKFDGTVKCSIILSRSVAGSFGGDVGCNSENVCVSIISADSDSDSLATDIVRATLESSSSCEEAISVIKDLVEKNGSDATNINLLVCDKNEAQTVTVANKSVSSEKISDPFKSLGNDDWPLDTPTEGFNVTNMFEVLRKAGSSAKSSFVTVLNLSGLSSHWFTASPNPNESVFKPFIFTPSARISPLTQIAENAEVTLLNKLHSNRKWDQVGSLLQSLEITCVEEVNGYINDNPNLEELDELFKDCTEAEVKFYR